MYNAHRTWPNVFACKYIHTADYIIVYTLTYREYKVELLDRSFQPMILLIEEGDRVWWFWDKFKVKHLQLSLKDQID